MIEGVGMQFQGWWVAGDSLKVEILPATFDDTELSEASDWREAHQNEDPLVAHGFLDLDKALADARDRLSGGLITGKPGS